MICWRRINNGSHSFSKNKMTISFGTFKFHSTTREAFRSGTLVKKWAKEYKQIFDTQDVQIALNQPDYHFYEWLMAILVYQSTGYLSLVEQYEFIRHIRKQSILRKMISKELFAFIQNHKKFGSVQCPDLFVYASDYTDWFFCEVKGPNDKLRTEQTNFFLELEKMAGKPIFVIKLEEYIRITN